MNARFASLNAWADELFDLFEVAAKPITSSSFHVSSVPAAAANTAYTFTTGSTLTTNWGGGATGGYVYTQPTVEWYEPVTKYITNCGTPWDNVNGFPPVRIELNKDTKSLRFTFALAGVTKNLVDLEFDEDKMVLIIKKDDEDKEKKKKESSWAILKNSIKTSISGEYRYDVPSKRYDVAKATAKWEGDLLVAEVPVKDSVKPTKVKIS